MLLIRGHAGGTTLTGTIHGPEAEAPRFRGAPDADAPFTWLCDAFFEVESGRVRQEIDGREIHVAFEAPVPKGFESREAAVAAAKDLVRTQFARLGAPDPSLEAVPEPH